MTTLPVAWVTLLMKGDSYLPGVLTLKNSLDAVKSVHPLVCMVTIDVSKEARDILVESNITPVDIDYISVTNYKHSTAYWKDAYPWMGISPTKVAALSLTQYSKVVFLDADLIFMKNCDELFDIQTPAAMFAYAKCKPYNPKGMTNPYGGYLPYGQGIPFENMRKGLKGAFVLSGSLFVVTPDKKDFELIKKLLFQYKIYGHMTVGSGVDEQLLAEYYSVKWYCNNVRKIPTIEINDTKVYDINTVIDPYNLDEITKSTFPWYSVGLNYCVIPWHESFFQSHVKIEPKIFHFIHKKPWLMKQSEWPDLKIWFDHASDLVKNKPELKKIFPTL